MMMMMITFLGSVHSDYDDNALHSDSDDNAVHSDSDDNAFYCDSGNAVHSDFVY